MSISTFLSNPVIAGASSLAGTLFNGINGIMSGINTKKMIDAQKQMNQANIASQERINQQNIDFQKGINDIMRHDANNAISIKKQDLINAGYSTADPNMQGNAIAQLGSPQLQAPQVESEFNSDMANYQQNAIGSLAQSLMDNANVLTDIQLKKAQEREHDSNADFREKEIAWYDVNSSVALKNAIADLNLRVQQGELNEQQLEIGKANLDLLKSQFTYLGEQIFSLKVENEYKRDNIIESLNYLRKSIVKLDSAIVKDIEESKTEKHKQNYYDSQSNLAHQQALTESNKRDMYDAQVDNYYSSSAESRANAAKTWVDKDIKEFEKDITFIKRHFAFLGINFDSSNMLNVVEKNITSPNLLHNFLKFSNDQAGSLIDSYKNQGSWKGTKKGTKK